ncbi:hypothetical protein [Aliiroseovarius sp. F20344]|uniref:hypothetical protein n=1 Tax=Aliiroseovarius sp. F20344 TaxID=2926414 RepID=UPI001FF58BFD|nr:hypothetical protein [Aliiroseovarius sp. F20344]MCK0141185.1 hypothetical protein [Aliiroseovarius sp. F20344]
MALGFEIPAVALRKSGAAPVVPFSPLQLSPSAMFDAADTTKLFQDSAGTTPVTADNQPIGLWQDNSQNGVDLSQPVSAARPSYRTDGNYQWVETDGVDDGLETASLLRVGNPLTMVLGYEMLSTTGTSRVNFAEIGRNRYNAMSIGSRPNIDRLRYYSRLSDEGVSSSHPASPQPWGGHQKRIATLQAVPGQVSIRMDGVEVLNTTQNLGTEFIEPHPLKIGMAGLSGSIPGAFRLFGIQVWDATKTQPTAVQIPLLEQWMADRIGVTL